MEVVANSAPAFEMEPPGEAGRDPFPFAHDSRLHRGILLGAVLLPFALTVWAIVSLWGRGVGVLELGLLVGAWCVTGLGITVGFHRLLTHRAFETTAWVRAVLLIIGSATFQGRPDEWAATHIKHHARADRPGDPHSPVDGLWHAHAGWLYRSRFVRSGPVFERLTEDPVVRWVSRWTFLWAVLGLLIPAAITGAATGSLSGAWSGFLWGGVVRVFMGHHITWSVNSVGHAFGTRPFVTRDASRNNVVVAILGFGEGWHNNHHAFPRSAFLGLRWWQFDPGAWVIRTLTRLGLAWNVWNPSSDALKARAAQ